MRKHRIPGTFSDSEIFRCPNLRINSVPDYKLYVAIALMYTLLDLPSGTRFQLTSGTFVHTQRSADNLKLTCSLFLTKLQY